MKTYGSKNRILLGYITNRITHYFRNTFANDIYITKVTAEKIKIKHLPLDKEFIYNKLRSGRESPLIFLELVTPQNAKSPRHMESCVSTSLNLY